MLGSKILVAYDGSELAGKALDAALELVQTNPETEADVVFVEEISLLQNGVETIDKEIQRRDNRIFEDVQAKLSGRSNRVGLHRLQGREAPYVILRFAEENSCDLIIIGSRGLTGLRELLGSVSHTVVQHAAVPVLVIK